MSLGNNQKKILIMATRPFLDDGMTKVEMEIYDYNCEDINFEFSTGYYSTNKYIKRLEQNGVKLNRLPSKKMFLIYMIAIYKLIKRESYDAVYIHGNSAMMLLEALPAKLAGCQKIITHCHNTKARFTLIHYLFKPIFNIIVDKKVACSSYAADWAYGKTESEIVVNGIPINKFAFDSKVRDRIRNELNLNGCFVIGHVGRFCAAKNHLFLLDIFKEIYMQNSCARLLLIGEGELMHKVREKACRLGISDMIYYLGIRQNVNDYMQAMDVMVLPSLYEGLCIVAIEAQANGLPLVMADTLSPESYIANNVYSVPLQKDAQAWGKLVLRAQQTGRIENGSVLEKKGYSDKRMMEMIREVLLD